MLICLPVLKLNKASVLVEWTTASELDTAGFNLYRSEVQSGPFVQINQDLIPTSSDPLSGGSYQFEDNAVQPGKTYYYELEDVELNGGTNRFGPIQVTAQGLSSAALYAIGGFLVCVGAAGVLALRRGSKNRLADLVES